MNNKLLEEIVRHVFASLLIIESDFIDLNSSKSLKSKDFLLKEKLDFSSDDETISNNIWGCNISSEDQEIKIILADCSLENNKEYCLIVQLKNTPAWGAYLIDQDFVNERPGNAFLACTINEKDWMECNTYLQSAFLSGMEHIKELGLSWTKCSDYKDHINLIKSFIKYHDSFYEAE